MVECELLRLWLPWEWSGFALEGGRHCCCLGSTSASQRTILFGHQGLLSDSEGEECACTLASDNVGKQHVPAVLGLQLAVPKACSKNPWFWGGQGNDCNCFIRWVLILSWISSRIDPESDVRCTGRQHSKIAWCACGDAWQLRWLLRTSCLEDFTDTCCWYNNWVAGVGMTLLFKLNRRTMSV